MSLINDALKKAQRQRTGDNPLSHAPMPGGASPARAARASAGPSPQLLLVGAGALLGLAIAGGALFLFRGSRSDPTPVPPSASVAAESAPTSAKPTAATASVAATANPPAAQPVEPIATVKTETAPAASVSTPATSAATAATPPVVAPEPPAPSLRMIEAVEALRVAGIRASAGGDAKVLMNDRVFRLGDTVDHALGIKLAGVTADSLTFRDASGATYTRNF